MTAKKTKVKMPVAQKLLPAPKATSPDKVKTIFRLISALIFAILGFNFGNSEFFYAYPLFGVNYLAQLLITPVAALIGYFIVFELLNQIRKWFEHLIINTVVEIVSSFWELQSKKIQEQRRQKQKVKSEKEKNQLETTLKTAVVLDTSALIDGRILELVRLNFLDFPLIIPQEVIDELHLLSDNKDSLKRQKGRRGLDIIRDLKKRSAVFVRKIGNGHNGDGVDKMLVNFAKNAGLKLATLDFNLGKVAGVAGVKVLNINELANSIKTVLLPGETVVVKVIHEGKEKQQGVGYLDDGTMIVVEGARDKVGQQVTVIVAKVIQSPAGKIVFCK